MTLYRRDPDLVADELADLEAEDRWQRQQHRKLMSLPPGHPDEPDPDDYCDAED